MNFVFSNQKVQELAIRPLTFENWAAFRQAMIDSCELPACYDLPQFTDPDKFWLELGKVTVNKVSGGQNDWISQLSGTLFGEIFAAFPGKITILQFLELDPGFILK